MCSGRLLHRLVIVVLLTVEVLWCLAGPASAMSKAGQPVPNFRVVSTSGQVITPENYKGHVLIIDFFASWCQPCRASIPHILELNRKFGKQGLQVLGISADEDGERVIRAFAEENRINYPVAQAAETTLADFGVRSVPVMMVVDKKGKIAEVFRGFNAEIGRSSDQLIKRLLSEQ